MNNYLEIKKHKNKPEQQFHCEVLFSENGHAVLRYVAHKAGVIADMRIPSGTTTIAHYWQDRPYVAWRMFDSDHALIGTLFHICTNVCIYDDHLSYEDLLVDIWITPNNKVRVLDEDELQDCIDRGLISDAELCSIQEAEQDILSHHPEIIYALTTFDCKTA